MKDFFYLSVSNLKRRKLRSLLTMIGIFIGIAAVVALMSLGQGLQNAIEEQFQKLGSNKIIIQERGVQGPPGSGTSLERKLTSKDLDAVKEVNGVKNAAGLIFKTGKIEKNDEIKFVFVQGAPLEPKEKELISFFEVIEGRDLKKGDTKKIVVGQNYKEGKVFEKKIGIGDKISIEGSDFQVIGFFEKIGNPFDDSAIIMPKEEMKKLFKLEDEESLIYAEVENIDEIQNVKERIEQKLRRVRDEEKNKETFETTTSDQILQQFTNIFGIVQAVLVGIAGISLLVGGVGIANTMYTAVLERTKEIGIMKAIGARNSDILFIFIIESGLIGLIGGAIGIIIGLGLSKLAEYYATIQLGTNLLQASTNLSIIVGALLFSFLIGVISGVTPAFRASKLNPVDALRYE